MWLISSIRASTRSITVEELVPKSLMTMPATTSSTPLRVCTPRRTAPPTPTSATCSRKTGVPWSALMTMFSMSSMVEASPTERTTYSSASFSMNWAPTLRLLASICSITSCRVTP